MYFNQVDLDHLYFTSDQHFMHDEILKYRTDFDSVKQMNNTIINNYNKCIDEKDVCVNLGDFSLTNNSNIYNLQSIRSKLHGKIELILGNHDLFSITTYLDVIGIDNIHKFEKVLLPYTLKMDELCPYVFCHDPACATVLSNCICICGHIHTLFTTLYVPTTNVLLINVGVDVWNYKPIAFMDVLLTVTKSDFKPLNTTNVST